MYRKYVEAEILSAQPMQINWVVFISCLRDHGHAENTKQVFIIRELS